MTTLDKIKQALEAAGLGDRIGKVHGVCNHSCGLPQQERVMVRPDWSPIDGAHVVVVTAERVSSYGCHYPSNFNDWSSRGGTQYGTPDEMVSLVQQRVEQPKGCW
jgi:hypothetical protein